ncbi:MAG TPA: FadR/GntR family transcriptional regulator, partial [Ktedonobacterales bacterium]
ESMRQRGASLHYQPLSAVRLHEGIVRQIVTQIVRGALPPGSALPSETSLAQQFGVSRTVIREAARLLAAKGLISVRHGSGMQVLSPEHWNYLDPFILIEQLRSGQAQTVLRELLELRQVVESATAALAAQRRDDGDLAEMRMAMARMREVVADPFEYTRWDMVFHGAILTAAQNRLLARALRQANQGLLVGRLISSQRPSGPEISLGEHEAILRAIEQQQSEEARRLMLEHIIHFEGDIQSSLEAGIPDSVIERALEML